MKLLADHESAIHPRAIIALSLRSSSRHIGHRFGERLRRLRKAKGYTQERLALHLGIDRAFISDLERGKKNLSLSYLETIAQGFGLTLSELMQDL